MLRLCYGCMKLKENSPICERCGYDERTENNNHQLPVGTKVGGQYVLGRVLGQGGFGITYSGWDMILNIPVAVKEYFPSGYAGRDTRNPLRVTSYDNQSSHDFERNKQRFLREADTLGKFWNVPQIVRILRHFEENGTAYIAMEYVEGMDLRHYLKQLKRPMTVAETLKVLGPVMEALDQIHSAELVHRDISPDNIMILPDGRAKLLDFGAARYVENADAEKERNTSTQAILKHGFAPPEQYTSHGALGPWTDIYAMCGTIYYCLTGKIPPEAMTRFTDGAAINWSSIPGLTSRQLSALEKGMALQAKDRYPRVQELWTDLRPDTPRPAPAPKVTAPVNPAPKAATPVNPAPAKQAPVKQHSPNKKKSRLLPAIAAIAAVVLIVAGAMLIRDNTIPLPALPGQTETPISQSYDNKPYTSTYVGYTLTYVDYSNGVAITGYAGTLPEMLMIPESLGDKYVVAIGEKAFKGCSQIKKLVVPASVATIKEYAFQSCPSLEEVILPDNLKTIESYAFHSCTALTHIQFPKFLKSIENYAFRGCTGLEQITLPKVCSAEKSAFPNECRIVYE